MKRIYNQFSIPDYKLKDNILMEPTDKDAVLFLDLLYEHWPE